MMTSRRGLMAAAAAIAAGSAASAEARAKPKTPAPAPWTPDAVEIAGRIRRKEVSALEVTEKAVRDAEALQDRLGFMVTSDFDRAIDKAKRLDAGQGASAGPFAGVPFLVKDLDDYVGLPTRSGSRAMLRSPPATTQEPYTDCFDKAGLIVIGKSSTPEYGFLPTTEPVGFPVTPQSLEPGTLQRRLVRRGGGGDRGGGRALRPRQRRRRLDPHPGLQLRPVWPEALARPHGPGPSGPARRRPVGLSLRQPQRPRQRHPAGGDRARRGRRRLCRPSAW
jgi:hypothetical protein